MAHLVFGGSFQAGMILVDDARWPWRGRQWAHLVSDDSYEELHRFAERLGIPRSAFQGDHYDLPAEVRDFAIDLGATAVSSRELLIRLRRSGLRLPPSKRRNPGRDLHGPPTQGI